MAELRYPAIDPVFLDLWGPLDLRYYGLMYVVGFIVGQYILVRLARVGFLPMASEKVSDLIFALVLGVMLGGRIGYSLFYKPEMWTHPLDLFKIWQGGLSFHGGLLGVVIAFIWFGRKHGVPAWRLCDATALAATPGIFAVRIANFINGELYGRIIRPGDWTPPWAMRFPTDPHAKQALDLFGLPKREQELKIVAAFKDGTWDQVAMQVPLRHPSQLYEALGEGLILGLVLWGVWRMTRTRPLGTGSYGGIFLMGYGIIRFVIEFFRQPDAQFQADPSNPDQLGTVLSVFSMGQVLCTLMIVAGLLLLLFRRDKYLPLTPPAR